MQVKFSLSICTLICLLCMGCGGESIDAVDDGNNPNTPGAPDPDANGGPEPGNGPGPDDDTDDPDATPAARALIGTVAVVSAQESVQADGGTKTAVVATVTDINGTPVSGAVVRFGATLGVVAPNQATTSADGNAYTVLTSGTKAGQAIVIAEAEEGFKGSATVQFLPGPVAPEQSTLTASPSVLPADGISTATVVAVLRDANDNEVADDTEVALTASLGSVSPQTATTANGRAEFSLTAPQQTGTAQVRLAAYPDVATTLLIGARSSGDPASVRTSATNSAISVTGVGKLDQSSLSVQIVDSAGDPIDEGSYNDDSLNNAEACVLSSPRGGEYLSGVNAVGAVVQTSAQTPCIALRSTNGTLTFNVQAGTLPGLIEAQIKVIVDKNGNVLLVPVTTLLPQLSIASGPPNTIALTSPVVDAIENIGGGVYSRIGTAIVTDRWGNAVPDGTVINLGLVDSVLASGTGAFTNDGTTLTDPSADFLSARVVRNEIERFIKPNDRMLITNANPHNKSRFVGSFWDSQNVSVNAPFTPPFNEGRTDGKRYIIGASLLGGNIAGEAASGNETTGIGFTQGGLALFRVTYPANANTILAGCYSDPTIDTRHPPAGSARVFMVATSSLNDASTAVDERFCFAAIASVKLSVFPSALSGSGFAQLALTDANDIPLPFVSIGSSVKLDSGSLNVEAPGCTTDTSGACVATISVSDRDSGDAATVSYQVGGVTAAVSIKIP